MNSTLALENPLHLSRADALNIAKEILLAPAGISEQDLQKTLAHMHTHQLDDADLYFQRTHNESWSLEEGIVK
jgi:TldD protein